MPTVKKKPIHISVDEDLKEQAEQLFNELGLNMTSAINVFLKQAVTEQAIPFEIRKANKDTLEALNDVKSKKLHGGFNGGFECLRFSIHQDLKKTIRKL